MRDLSASSSLDPFSDLDRQPFGKGVRQRRVLRRSPCHRILEQVVGGWQRHDRNVGVVLKGCLECRTIEIDADLHIAATEQGEHRQVDLLPVDSGVVSDEGVEPATVVDHALGHTFGRRAFLRREHGLDRWPVLGHNQVERMDLLSKSGLAVGFRNSGKSLTQLCGEDIVSRHSSACERHDKRHPVIVYGRMRGDHAAFAVAEEPDATGVDLLACSEVLQCGPGIVRKVEGRGRQEVASGLADAAIIIAERCDTLDRQFLSEPGEGLERNARQ